MTSTELIDAQFDRAVEIVQSLPKNGPIQTDYEEKLTMYSLYKQATVGNVTSPRPGMFDMLGRAKWDAWAKHKDLDSYEAKWLYVDALLKVLRKYSDKTIARALVEELESYGGDPSNIVMSRTLSARTPDSDTSGSTDSDEPPPRIIRSQTQHSDFEAEAEDETRDLPVIQPQETNPRPNSSMSSRRYRTPMADTLAMSPPPGHHVVGGVQIPTSQPMPGFETPSAFAEPSNHQPSGSVPSSFYQPTGSSSFVGPFSQASEVELSASSPPANMGMYPLNRYQYQGQQPPLNRGYTPISRPTLERAVENVQVQLAALSERLDTIEGNRRASKAALSPRGGGSGGHTPLHWVGRGASPSGRNYYEWDLEDLGMWSVVIIPVSKGIERLREVSKFFAKNDSRSPTMIVVRRLCLDVSFLFFVVLTLRLLWKRSGVRRREVYAAFKMLMHAILGTKDQRVMVDRGV